MAAVGATTIDLVASTNALAIGPDELRLTTVCDSELAECATHISKDRIVHLVLVPCRGEAQAKYGAKRNNYDQNPTGGPRLQAHHLRKHMRDSSMVPDSVEAGGDWIADWYTDGANGGANTRGPGLMARWPFSWLEDALPQLVEDGWCPIEHGPKGG